MNFILDKIKVKHMSLVSTFGFFSSVVLCVYSIFMFSFWAIFFALLSLMFLILLFGFALVEAGANGGEVTLRSFLRLR